MLTSEDNETWAFVLYTPFVACTNQEPVALLISLPVVQSNNTISLSTELFGHTTSQDAAQPTAATSIDHAALVICIPLPAVNVDLLKLFAVPLPINTSQSVIVDRLGILSNFSPSTSLSFVTVL